MIDSSRFASDVTSIRDERAHRASPDRLSAVEGDKGRGGHEAKMVRHGSVVEFI